MKDEKKDRRPAHDLQSEETEFADSLLTRESVERRFLTATEEALAETGCSALELLNSSSKSSVNELFDSLPSVSKWACSAGLKMAIYDEAVKKNVVRETARDLLFRDISREFPGGWLNGGKPDALSKLFGWYSDIESYVSKRDVAELAEQIIRHLTIDHPPSDGWKPESKNDPLINEIFDRYWPVES